MCCLIRFPTKLKVEKACNPFLRTSSTKIRQSLKHSGNKQVIQKP
ncbi:hypothetical protein NC653_019590 [Populus alba x Populus x berolinensis]|uniref:Hydroxyacylglutathione hydrolase C-terminal domain-containing protein n=1 Tax=Populus alba x Populus x berolinensis TaxID=444605 RepID=A0AAD6QJ96_9ROSI|nr:hypothetical protein NC653_019590 [Populus alba x Populus x berolinensis]